jgi:hypothetical protein
VLNRLLLDIQVQLVDLSMFLQHLPAFTPIHKGPEGELPARSFYSVFDKRTLYLLNTYVWYSMLYTYIQASENDDLFQMDVMERKDIQRQNIREHSDAFGLGQSFERNSSAAFGDYDNEMMEMQIVSGDQKEIKTRVAEMLLIFLEMDETNKKSFDFSYDQLEKRLVRSKLKEKKMITDFLRDMEKDERRVEDMKKIMKLGRWNVGLTAGLVNYDKERYNEERKDLINQMMNLRDVEDEEIPIHRDIQELEQEEYNDMNEEYDNEANDINGLDEDYRDGNYYQEDME